MRAGVGLRLKGGALLSLIPPQEEEQEEEEEERELRRHGEVKIPPLQSLFKKMTRRRRTWTSLKKKVSGPAAGTHTPHKDIIEEQSKKIKTTAEMLKLSVDKATTGTSTT